MGIFRLRSALFLAVACGISLAASSLPAADYLRDVKPILEARCYACHGALKQESGLRLDTGRSIRQGGDSGATAVPGKPGESLLIERVSAADADERMPPEGEPLTAPQIEQLRQWIAAGAASPDDEPPQADPREHWAFQRPQRQVVPVESAEQAAAAANPIDAFVAREHVRNGLIAQPPAPRPLLLRRIYLDLIGLPPTREELRAFLADEAPDAYERVVDRLLADPRYGERWGRHWMDVWRYSDWYGRRHVPDVWNSAPQIWRWRDWIVRSLCGDKGYDQMIREMLAADEICPEDDQAAVATGYLIRNWYALNPNDWMRSTVEHTGKAFLGLTFNCAHCHDHKYDPIAQDDYFRLRAFFEPIYVRQDRVPGETDPGPFQDYEYSTLRKVQRLGAVRVFDKAPDAPTWFYTGGDERNRVSERGSIAPGVPEFLDASLSSIEPVELPPRAWYPGLRPAIQATVRREAEAAIEQAEAELNAARQAEGESAELRVKAAAAHVEAARAELASVEARIAADKAKFGEDPDADAAALARDASRLERLASLCKQEADSLAKQVALAVAEAKPESDANRAKEIETATQQLAAARTAVEKAREAAEDTSSETYSAFSPVYPQSSTGRRRALAEWIASRDNPLTARVAVNHIWMRHFHAPLVESVYDFGLAGSPPTHPELLDWLAAELMDRDWRMKHVHRLMVSSQAYRRGSGFRVQGSENAGGESETVQQTNLNPEPRTLNPSSDSDNRFLWRMNAGRIEAEVLRDSLLYLAGRLDFQRGGQELENSESLKTWRRSVYYSVFPEQGGKSALGELFDAPDALECYRRTRSIVPQQALALTNSELVHEVSREIVGRWTADEVSTGDRDEPFIAAMFEQILSRLPTEPEREACLDYLSAHRELLKEKPPEQAVAAARESLVRALLNHNDFLTIR